MLKKRLDKPNPIRAGGFRIGGPQRGRTWHPNLLVDHRRSRSAAVVDLRGANGGAVTGSGGRLQIGMVGGFKSESGRRIESGFAVCGL